MKKKLDIIKQLKLKEIKYTFKFLKKFKRSFYKRKYKVYSIKKLIFNFYINKSINNIYYKLNSFKKLKYINIENKFLYLYSNISKWRIKFKNVYTHNFNIQNILYKNYDKINILLSNSIDLEIFNLYNYYSISSNYIYTQDLYYDDTYNFFDIDWEQLYIYYNIYMYILIN